MNEDNKNVKISFEDFGWTISVAMLCVLFIGTPDLMDAILFFLTDGQIPLPKP